MTVALFFSRLFLTVIGCCAESEFIDGRPLRSGLLAMVATAGFIVLGWYTIADRSVSALISVSIAAGIGQAVVAQRRKESL